MNWLCVGDLNGSALTCWPDVLGVMDGYLDDDSQRRDAHVVAKSSQSVTIQKFKWDSSVKNLRMKLAVVRVGYLLEHCFSLFTYWIGVTVQYTRLLAVEQWGWNPIFAHVIQPCKRKQHCGVDIRKFWIRRSVKKCHCRYPMNMEGKNREDMLTYTE